MKKSILFITILILVMVAAGCTNTDTEEDRFAFSLSELTLDIGETVVLQIDAYPEGREYTLSSSNSTIVRVEGETITTLREGMAYITAQSGDLTASIKILVTTETSSGEHGRQYSVSYITEKGEAPIREWVKEGEKATEPPALLDRDGYVFTGWYTDDDFETLFDFDATQIWQRTILYAGWEVDSNIRYDYIDIDGKLYIDGFFYNDIEYSEAVLPEFFEDSVRVFGINESAFEDNNSLVSITIPSSYEKIGESAFRGAKMLEEVIFEGEEDVLEKIDNYAFWECIKLAQINLPNSVRDIGDLAFYKTIELDNFAMPTSIYRVRLRAFLESGISSIDLYDAVVLDREAFAFTNLEQLSYNQSLLNISRDVFLGTPWLNQKLNSEGYVALNNILIRVKANTPQFTMPEGIIKVAQGCFANSENIEITLQENTKPVMAANTLPEKYFIIVEEGHFDNFIAVYPDLSENIYFLANFEGADYSYEVLRKKEESGFVLRKFATEKREISLTDIFDGKIIKNLKTTAFSASDCPNLVIVNIPSSIEFISARAFNTPLRALIIDQIDDNIPAVGGNPVNSTAFGKYKLYVAEDKKVNYQSEYTFFASSNIYASEIIREDGLSIKYEEGEAIIVQYLGEATQINITSHYDDKPLMKIMDFAFSNNKTLQTITLEGGGEQVIEIGEQAFNRVDSLNDFICLYENPPTLGSFPFGSPINYTISVPIDFLANYQTSWNNPNIIGITP